MTPTTELEYSTCHLDGVGEFIRAQRSEYQQGGEYPHGACYHLVVDNPAKLNVLGSAIIAELREAIIQVARTQDARLVTLTGAGSRAWIGGADIREMAKLTPASASTFIRELHELCETIRTVPIPVLAVINGYCLGAGMEVAACCDLRIGASHAVFGLPEVQVGIPTVIEGAMMPKLIGIARTQDLVLSGRTIDAATALDWGFLNARVETDELWSCARTWQARLLTAGPNALRLQKRLLRDWLDLPLPAAIESGVVAFAEAFETDEPGQYLNAFLDRRRPETTN